MERSRAGPKGGLRAQHRQRSAVLSQDLQLAHRPRRAVCVDIRAGLQPPCASAQGPDLC